MTRKCASMTKSEIMSALGEGRAVRVGPAKDRATNRTGRGGREIAGIGKGRVDMNDDRDQQGIGNSASETLAQIGRLVGAAIDTRRSDVVAPAVDAEALRSHVEQYDLNTSRSPEAAAGHLADLLRRHAVRSDHPRYFGLFNPPALVPAIAGDLVASALNPQLAVWSHAPAAAEIERRLIRLFGSFVWPEAEAAGTFTSGGSEANSTALLVALALQYPDWQRRGVPRDGPRPAIYASAESHLAWIKIARAAGLGGDAVRLVPAERGLAMTGKGLERAIATDVERGWRPVMVVATAGTTAHGAVDDLAGIAKVGRAQGAHVHVDAAWAGGALLHPRRAGFLLGVEQADSVTIDPHKWLSVPMGAGLYLDRSWDGLARAFSVSTGYMPSASEELRDPYIHSLQWSRRFIGAKLFTALATLGLDGYRALIDRSFELADRLRMGLARDGWIIRNDTGLPLVCFAPADAREGLVLDIERTVARSGAAWISSVRLQGSPVLRACITSFETSEADVDALLGALRVAREECD